jgi:hypothetical protein
MDELRKCTLAFRQSVTAARSSLPNKHVENTICNRIVTTRTPARSLRNHIAPQATTGARNKSGVSPQQELVAEELRFFLQTIAP